jgi:hypothetical protein
MQKHSVFLRSVFALFLILCVNVVMFGQSSPGFSPAPGFYTTSIQVSLFAVPGDVIYYTLDGSEPDDNSMLYSGAITVDSRSDEVASLAFINRVSHSYATWAPPKGDVQLLTTIRARTKRDGLWGKTATATYIVHPDGINRFSLPLLSVVTDSLHLFDDDTGIYVLGTLYNNWRAANPSVNPEPGSAPANYFGRGDEWERPAHFEMFETDGSRVISQDIGLRLHGGLSRALRAKSFRLYSRSEYGVSRFRYPIFPSQELDNYNRLILRASGQDWAKTMFRDAMIQRLVGHLTFETMAYRPSVLFVNGEFWGIYNIRERYDRHYLSIKYDIPDDKIDLLTGNASVKEGSSMHYNALRSYIRGGVGTSRYAYIKTQMDVENFIDYNISNIYINNRDWPHNNIDFWRYQAEYDPSVEGVQDGRWRWMMFDTDFGFAWTDIHRENTYQFHVGQNLLEHATREGTSGAYGEWSTEFLRRLLANVEFRRDFINRYRDLANTAFRANRVVSVINEMQAVIEPHMDEHLDRWGYLETDRWSPPFDVAQWDVNVEYMRRFALEREANVNDHFTSKFNLGSLYTISVSVQDTTMGFVRVNRTDIRVGTPSVENVQHPANWTGRYFNGTPITVSAVSHEGYRFSHWMNEQTADSVYTFSSPVGQLVAVFEPTSVSIDYTGPELPEKVGLGQNYPNPFNPTTQIRFDLPEATSVRLEVFDVTGRSIVVAANGTYQAGPHQISVNLHSFAGGVYFYRLTTPNESITRSMVLLK